MSVNRARATFVELARAQAQCQIVTLAGAMGSDALHDPESGSPLSELFEVQVIEDSSVTEFSALERIGETATETSTETIFESTAESTRAGVKLLAPQVDLLVFVGGDGTARDVLDALAEAELTVPVLGIPAGVKMHSGVFATSPGSAAQLLSLLIDGGLVAAHWAEVKDIDEQALRSGTIGSVRYGEMLVPSAGGYLQHVKSAGKEVEALVLLEIAAEVAETFCTDSAATAATLVLGPGSTCMALKEQLLGAHDQHLATLLGVDVIAGGKLLIKDATATDLEAMQASNSEFTVFVSFSRGQGFVLGRGNQQLSPALLEHLPVGALQIVSSRTKLATLNGRPLLIDSGSAEIDKKFAGLRSIISGYQDRLLYLVEPA